MTDAEVAEIDRMLKICGWRYDAARETFFNKDGKEVEWPEVLVALPDLSLNQLEAYRDRKLAK